MKSSSVTETAPKTKTREVLVDVRELPCRERHKIIFNEWQSLGDEQCLLLVNDHDPVPLFHQFQQFFPNAFSWDYLQRGPDVWKIYIGKSKHGHLSKSTSEPLILDVRPMFKRGESPCHAIDEAVESLQPQQPFFLLVPFEPNPLIAKLGRQGFTSESFQEKDGSWRIEFRREPVSNQGKCCCGSSKQKKEDLCIDTRDMEPPQPLVMALESLKALSPGQRLKMHSSRRPMHLFDQLDERGFTYDCDEQTDHSFITTIWKDHESC